MSTGADLQRFPSLNPERILGLHTNYDLYKVYQGVYGGGASYQNEMYTP